MASTCLYSLTLGICWNKARRRLQGCTKTARLHATLSGLAFSANSSSAMAWKSNWKRKGHQRGPPGACRYTHQRAHFWEANDSNGCQRPRLWSHRRTAQEPGLWYARCRGSQPQKLSRSCVLQEWSKHSVAFFWHQPGPIPTSPACWLTAALPWDPQAHPNWQRRCWGAASKRTLQPAQSGCGWSCVPMSKLSTCSQRPWRGVLNWRRLRTH